MKFKKFYSEKIITEITSSELENIELPTDVKNLLERKILPFNNIFGEESRIVIPFKIISETQRDIEKILANDYNLDLEKWVGFKLNDSDKKNPTKIGKLLKKRQEELKRFIRDIPTDLSKETWSKVIDDIDKLLKIPELQKKSKESANNEYSIVLSRVPIDVVRMSDFSWHSCHSIDGSYFYCAVADAMLNAAIAYVVKTDDLKDVDLNSDEIFNDLNRDIEGIEPLARIRIRRVIDRNGEELAVPSLKVYKTRDFLLTDDFRKNIINWAKTQNISSFDFSSTLTLRGGDYEDAGYEISAMVKQIWGENISYSHASDDIEQVNRNHEEEHWWDNIVEELDSNESTEILDKVFDDSYFPMTVDIQHRAQDVTYRYDIPDNLVNKINILIEKFGVASVQEFVNKRVRERSPVNTWHYDFRNNNIFLKITSNNRPSIGDFGDYFEDSFDFEGYYFVFQKAIKSEIKGFLEKDLREDLNDIDSDSLDSAIYRIRFNDQILRDFNLTDDFEKDVSKLYSEVETLFDFPPEEKFKDIYSIADPDAVLNFTTNNYYTGEYWITLKPEEFFKKIIDYAERAVSLISNHYGIDDDECSVINYKIIFNGYSVENFDKRAEGNIAYDSFYGTRKFIKPVSLKIDDITEPVDIIQLPEKFKCGLIFYSYISNKDFSVIFDTGNVGNVNKLLDELHYEQKEPSAFLKAFEEISSFEDLFSFVDKYSGYEQLELDLSSINRYMNNFDIYVSKLLQELNMAKGGIANQSGSTAPQQNTASGTQAPPSVSSNPSTKVNQPITTGTNSSMGMNKTGNQQFNPYEMDQIVFDKGTDFNNILQDPDTSTAVFQHISSSLEDPSYNNSKKIDLQNVLKNNQNFHKAYIDYIRQGKPLNTPQ